MSCAMTWARRQRMDDLAGWPPAPRDPPGHTRIERRRSVAVHRVLVLKLDHLGDFILGLPALERLRVHFPQAHITLVCGSWNVPAAAGLRLFDQVIAFDAFAANPAQAPPPDRDRLLPQLRDLLDQSYDLAIDLRVDDDTRPYLTAVLARVRCGIGTRSRFDFLDVFLPIDATRAQTPPPAVLLAHLFHSANGCVDHGYMKQCTEAPAGPAVLVFGPYLQIPTGRFCFSPYLEVLQGGVAFEVLVDDQPISAGVASGGAIDFVNLTPGGHFQFRLLASAMAEPTTFRFYGGSLLREPVSDVLHQSEYLMLLVELVAMRVRSSGLLVEIGA